MKKIIGCCVVLMSFCYALGVGKMTAEELDGLVDQYVLFEHGDFVRASIDELRAAERLAEPELAEAFYRAAMRFKARKEDESRLARSLFWLGETIPEERIGRLRCLALSESGTIGRMAVSGYFRRMKERPQCLEFLADVLRLNPSVRDAVWGRCSSYLVDHSRLTSRTEFFQDILGFAEKHAEDVRNALACDEILCTHKEGYAGSMRRRERIARMLKSAEIRSYPKLNEHFQRKLNGLGKK